MDLEAVTPILELERTDPELVAIVDDNPTSRRNTRALLQGAGYRVMQYESGRSAVNGNGQAVAVACVDLGLRDVFGLDVLAQLHARDPDLALIALAGQSESRMLVEAMRAGAYDCVTKPLQHERFIPAVRRACERGRLVRSVRRLETELGQRNVLESIIGQTPGAIPERERVVPLRELERRAIEAALRTTSGSVSKAAKLLGIGRATLYRRLAAKEVQRGRPRGEPSTASAVEH